MTMNNRIYNGIYLGGNEDSGRDKIDLSFYTNNKAIIFYADISNVFDYPEYLKAVKISDTSLVSDGAIAGISPNYSDRINYAEKCIPLGQKTMKDSFGVYLTTWLYNSSLGSETSAIWMDRWYNPAYISELDAYKVFYSNHGAIKDFPSRFQLEKGVTYSYFHYGNYTNKQQLNSIKDNLILHLDNWDTIERTKYNIINETINTTADPNYIVNRDIPKDYIPIKSTLNIDEESYNTSTGIKDDIILDLSNNVSGINIQYSNYTTIQNNFSVCLWARSDNWSNQNNHHIISNGFRSGWNIKINNGFYNTVMAFIDPNGNTIVYNIEGKLLYSYKLLIDNVYSYSIGDDLYLYVLGKNNDDPEIYLYKINIINGLIISQEDNSYNSSQIVQFNLDGNPTVLNDNESYDLNGITVENDYNFDIDNYNNIWSAKEDGIYMNDNLIYGLSAQKILCSHDDKLWAICNLNNGEYILNIYDISDIETIIEYSDILSINKTLKYSNILPITSDNYSVAFAIVNNNILLYLINFDLNMIYQLDKTGSIILSKPLFNINRLEFIKKDDFTSYNWNRKFSYIKNEKYPEILFEYVENDNGILKKNTISYNTSGLLIDKEWHHFAITVNQDLSTADLYIDTIKVGSNSINGNIYYIYESPMVIGAGSGVIRGQSYELKLDYCNKFKGYIDDLRIYNTPLLQAELDHIYTNKFRYRDVIFNAETEYPLYYIEQIERFFKFKIPGAKSHYYNIKISGLNLSGTQEQQLKTKQTIEKIIRDTVIKVAPAYTELYRIIWID